MRLQVGKFALAGALTMTIVRFVRMIFCVLPGSSYVVRYDGFLFSYIERRALQLHPAFIDYVLRLALTFATTYLIAVLFASLYNQFLASEDGGNG